MSLMCRITSWATLLDGTLKASRRRISIAK